MNTEQAQFLPTAKTKPILAAALILLAGVGIGYFYGQKTSLPQTLGAATVAQNKYISFVSEVFTLIQENYWDKLNEAQLAQLFSLAAQKATGEPQSLKENNLKNLQGLTAKLVQAKKAPQAKKELVAKIVSLVLEELRPTGRNRLYTRKDEKALTQRVQNFNPETQKVEPTVLAKLVRPQILHLRLTRVSPQTLKELEKTAQQFDQDSKLDTLILDLRGNIGGSIDLLPYLLGPFIGPDQYAYQFFHQGKKEDVKTKTGWLKSLVRYKKVVILVDERTQSSAELMTAALKKYNVGVVVGTRTRGWGTVEKVFPLQTQIDEQENYSLFLVHRLTLREDGQPIEGNGVEPVVNIGEANWQDQLFAYFHYPELTQAVEEIWVSPKDAN